MNKHIKISAIIMLSVLCTTSMAANRFIIKYKSDSDNMNINAVYEENKDTNKIKSPQVKKLADKKIIDLSQQAEKSGNKPNKIKESHVLFNGAFVIILDSDLDKNQTKDFIDSVKEDNSVEYIEEDRVVKITHNKLK